MSSWRQRYQKPLIAFSAAALLMYVLLEPVLSAVPIVVGATTSLLFVLWTVVLLRSKTEFFVIFSATFLIEVIGVHTGVPFGTYTYLESFSQFGLFGVPFLIGCAWYVLLVVVGELRLSRLLSAASLVLIDIPLEIVADRMGMWQWGSDFVVFTPVHNYVAWFVIGWLLWPVVQHSDDRVEASRWILLVLTSFLILMVAKTVLSLWI